MSLAMGNPAVHAPIKRHRPTRSFSRSSSYGQARDFDPILRNLSPTTTLRAFSEHDSLSASDLLHTSLQSSTSSQRALGVKAAQTCLDVRSWARELEDWEWPGTFDVPESAGKKHRLNNMTTASLVSEDRQADAQNGHVPVYWGSLLAVTVEGYEQRADEIVHQLDEIDVEELKDFVLSAHNEAGTGSASIDDSIGAIGAATDLRKLDDFTAVITATILQALPYLSRLNRLLDTWTIRLAILRQAPKFLDALAQARADLDHGWAAIAVSPPNGAESPAGSNFTRGTMIEMQSIIERKVGSLGRKLDRFLDDLEGRSETVPDSWIEEMEMLEQQYADWTVQAERRVLDSDLKKNRRSKNASVSAAQANVKFHRSPIDTQQATTGGVTTPSDDLLTPQTYALSDRMQSTGTTPVDTPPTTASESISPVESFDPSELSIPELVRGDSETLPSQQVDPSMDRSPARSNANSRRSSRSRRHVPIMLPYVGGDGQEYPSQGITGDLISRTGTPKPDVSQAPTISSSEMPATSVAKRRAMFAGDLERTQSLQRATKSPVRPFEHASNAFARLFKSESALASSDRSRSSSLRSEVPQRRGGSGQPDNGIIWGGRTPPSPKNSQRRKTLDSSPQHVERGRTGESNDSPVSADTNAPPVPSLPPKSPRRSLQSPMKVRASQSIPSPPLPGKKQAEPFPQFDFTENWPLSEPKTELDPVIKMPVARFHAQTLDDLEGPGLSSPKKPLESDSFDRMFIESLPGTPCERTVSPAVQDNVSDDPPSDYSNPPRPQSPPQKSAAPTVDPSMLNRSPVFTQVASFNAQDAPDSTPSSVRRPNHIDLPAHLGIHTSTDVPITPNSIASDTYSPEIQDARVSYFQVASPSLSRTNSVATTSPNHVRPISSHTSSPMRFRNQPPEEEAIDENEAMEAFNTRRASKISVDSQPRLEVKSIDLPRRKSSSSVVELDLQPFAEAASSPVSHRDVSMFPTPPTIHEERPRSPVSPLTGTPDHHGLRHKTSSLSMVSDQASPAPSPAPDPASEMGTLNSFMGKRRGLGIQSNHNTPISDINGKPETDYFDRHVSEVLQKLPAPIRFRSGAVTPQPRPAEARTFSGPRPKAQPRVASRAGGLTLAPADPSPNKRSPAANEPVVKLYHLTQAGREEPIKLFVRLVGEGERVMVRVGGGWADLADYLRQYAEHHGSRTVSGEVDVKAFGSSTTAGGNSSIHPALRRKASGPLSAEINGSKSNSPSPVTPVHERKEGTENLEPAATTTPSRPPLPPKSASRPTTADSNRPGSKHSWSEMSMAGPGSSGKKGPELPEQKARWVEGMMERVTKASAEKKGDAQKQKPFAELGKVGGTRRVVFKNTSGAEGGRN